MGAAKHQMMQRQDLESLGGEIAVQARALKRCKNHDDILLNQEDRDAERMAYAIATSRIKAGKVDAGRDELMEAIKAAIETSYGRCPLCQRWIDG